MKEIRPKLNEVELALLIEAMKTCKWDSFSVTDSFDPRYQLYRRFHELQKGRHVKKRILGPFTFAFDFRKKSK